MSFLADPASRSSPICLISLEKKTVINPVDRVPIAEAQSRKLQSRKLPNLASGGINETKIISSISAGANNHKA